MKLSDIEDADRLVTRVKEELAARMESVRKGFEGFVIHLEDRVREEPN